jgi:hypothetical protein
MAGILSEHEAPGKDTNSSPDVYSPSKSERKAIQLANSLFDKAKKHRTKYDSKWLDYYKFFRGIQWDAQRPAYRHTEVINFVFQTIQSSVPILTDRQPKIDFVPAEPQDRNLSQILNKVIDHDWKRGNWNLPIVEALYDAHIYGTCYGEMKGEIKNGKGVIEFESSDPFYAFPDPQATEVNKKGSYFIYAQPMDVHVAKKKYPDIAKFIRPDLIDLVGGDKAELGKARYQSPTDKYSSVESERSFDSFTEDTALHLECYIKDDTVEEVKEDGKFIKKKKYPKGRKITVVGGVLAFDDEYPYDDFEERFAPFAKMQNYVLPREFFGVSEIEQLISPQKIFNKIVSFTLDVLTLMGNPVWIVDTSAGIDPENLINRPGLVIEKERGSEVGRVEGTQLQPYVLQLIDRMQVWFNDIAGQTDVSAGAVPSGVTSGRAISAVQEAARTRLRLKSRLLDMFIQDLGQMYLSRVFQFYTAPRIFRITGDENSFSFFKMSIEEDEETGDKLVQVTELIETEEGQVVDGETAVFQTQGKFDVVASSGSGLPFARIERMEKAFQLFDRQVIDAEALLTDVDYPNKEAVLERLKEREEQAAILAAQQQAGQGPV